MLHRNVEMQHTMFKQTLGGRQAVVVYAEHVLHCTGAIDVLVNIFRDNVELCKKVPQDVIHVLLQAISSNFEKVSRHALEPTNVFIPNGIARAPDFLREIMAPNGHPLKVIQDRMMNVIFALTTWPPTLSLYLTAQHKAESYP